MGTQNALHDLLAANPDLGRFIDSVEQRAKQFSRPTPVPIPREFPSEGEAPSAPAYSTGRDFNWNESVSQFPSTGRRREEVRSRRHYSRLDPIRATTQNAPVAGCFAASVVCLVVLSALYGAITLASTYFKNASGLTEVLKRIPIGMLIALPAGIVAGVAFIVGSSSLAKRSLKIQGVPPSEKPADQNPQKQADRDLEQMQLLTDRIVRRLHVMYRVQITIAIAVFVVLVGLVVWTVFMITADKFSYATGFGSTSIASLVMVRWKWQPFEKASVAARTATSVDALALGLSQRLRSIAEITDPKARAKAQWLAATDYAKLLRGEQPV